MNITVFLNHSAVFTCETSGLHMGWRVQGTKLLPDSYHNITTSLLNVTINSTIGEMVLLARAEYNEARIQCVTMDYDFTSSIVESETAILNIQGKNSF